MLYFTGEIGCPLLSEPTSEFQTPVTFLLVDKTQRVGIHFLSSIARKILVIILVINLS